MVRPSKPTQKTSTNREPLFTLASANVLTEDYPYEYVGEKVERLLNFRYKPLPQVIAETGKALLAAQETR